VTAPAAAPVAALVDGAERGERRALARLLTVVESGGADARAAIAALPRRPPTASVVGITGAPGAGKSTLTDHLVTVFRTTGDRVAVLAIDPTSPFTGGAILGDRVRMQRHEGDPGVFVRSMATRGHLGGLASATPHAVRVLDAAGTDVVLIETVGVGQGEVDIVAAADISIVVLVPGTGDDLQAIKAGIMEIGDIFVVNKADREGADRLVQGVGASLALTTYGPADWTPPILRTEATSGAGVDVLWAEIGRFRQWAAGHRPGRRRRRDASRVRDGLAETFLRHVEAVLPSGELDRIVDAIGERRSDPYSAVADIMARVLPRSTPPESGAR
jgi:LAO/AO transport system kinase